MFSEINRILLPCPFLSPPSTFTPTGDHSLASRLDAPAVDTMDPHPRSDLLNEAQRSLYKHCPYNSVYSLPLKVVKIIIMLEFIEISELCSDIWPDYQSAADVAATPRCTAKLPVVSINT